MRKMMKYSRDYGGSDPELIEGDVFKMIIKVPEFNGKNEAAGQLGEVTGQVASEVTGEVKGEATGEVIAFLKVLKTAPIGRKVAQDSLGLKGQANFRERYLEPALSSGLVEMTQPDSPKSPTQKYRLTDKGKKIVSGLES